MVYTQIIQRCKGLALNQFWVYITDDCVPSLVLCFFCTGADVTAKDEDGDTSLHLALMRQTLPKNPEPSSPIALVWYRMSPRHCSVAYK